MWPHPLTAGEVGYSADPGGDVGRDGGELLLIALKHARHHDSSTCTQVRGHVHEFNMYMMDGMGWYMY